MNNILLITLISLLFGSSVVLANNSAPFVCYVGASDAPFESYGLFIEAKDNKNTVTIKAMTRRGKINEEASYFYFGRDKLEAQIQSISKSIIINFSFVEMDNSITVNLKDMANSKILLFGYTDKANCMSEEQYKDNLKYE